MYTTAATRSITATATDEDGTYTTGGNAAGALDPTFGTDGKTTTNIGVRDRASGQGRWLFRPDGKMVVVGSGWLRARTSDQVSTWHDTCRDGALDTSFGTGGHVARSWANTVGNSPAPTQ